MLSMTLAALGWGVWWVMLVLRRLAPGLSISLAVPDAISTGFAAIGFLVAILTVRARRSWLLFVAIPLLANAGLFFMPWLAISIWPPRS
jgi:hypothetical protein